MASYSVLFKNSAIHDIKKLYRQAVPRIISAIKSLPDSPFPPGHRKLHGSESIYRIRVGDYRVIYKVSESEREITVYYVRHRKDAYRK